MLSFRDANQSSIIEYLARLGFQPSKIRGTDYWYLSPLRVEKTPSFKVNAAKNVWYDHGIGEGGSFVDLGARLNNCTIQEFVKSRVRDSLPRPAILTGVPMRRENPLTVLEIGKIQSESLIEYLHQRGISKDTAELHCQEVLFQIGERRYSAIGFPNNSNAYELRNIWFKGSSSPKDLSFIDNHSGRISVFEGFLDFLSAIQIEYREIKDIVRESDFLVLNSLSLLARSVPILESRKEINLFLDNDLPGQKAKAILDEKGIRYHDASALFKGHKDVNEFLVATSQIKQNQAFRGRPKRMRR